MSRTFNKKFFDSMIKVVHIFLKWSVRAIYVLLIIILVGFLVTLFLPADLFDFNLENLKNIDIGTINVLNSISDGGLTGIVDAKEIILLLIFMAGINLFFFQFIQIQLRKIMNNIRNKSPFNEKNAKFLKVLGIAFLVSSVVLPSIGGWFFMDLVNTLKVYEATFNFSIHFQSVLMGALILILAYIFDYGTYLQEEHDMTV